MDGLEAVELRLRDVLIDNDEFRVNSEFFRKKYLQNKIKLLTINNDYLLNLQNYNTTYKQPIYDISSKLKVVNSRYINNYFIDIDSSIYGYGDIVPKETVMINSTGVGTLGRVNINYLEEPISTDVCIVGIKSNKVNNYYLMSFLQSKYGQSQINRYFRGSSGQTHIYTKDFNDFIIPIFSNTFQLKVENLIKLAQKKLKNSKTLYQQAKTLLLLELDLLNFEQSKNNIAIKSLSESFEDSGRLDSEYYQPKYDELEEKILTTHELGILKDFLTVNQRGTQPNYAESGLPVINSKYVQEGEVLLTDNRLATLPDKDNALFIQKGDVLINGTGVGTIGRSAPYLHAQEAIPDNHVTILRTKNLNPIFLSVYLNSIAGKYQVDKYFKGSSGQIELYPKDIANFYIPLVSDEIQQTIAEKIKSSFKLKAESKQLLDLAKLAVEMAIEQDEAVALDYINSQNFHKIAPLE